MTMFNDFAALKAEGAAVAAPAPKPNVEVSTQSSAKNGNDGTLSDAAANALNIYTQTTAEQAVESGNTPPETTTKDDVTGVPAKEPAANEQEAAAPAGKALDPGKDAPQTDPKGKLSENDIAEKAAQSATERLLRDLGFDSIETLKEKLNPPKELTPEEQKRQQDVLKAAVQNFAVSELNYDPMEFHKLETYRVANDEEIVFDLFKPDFIAANKDNPDYAGKDLEAEARYDFNALYHIDSENSKLADWGKKMINVIAEQVRNQQETKYKNAEAEYLQVTNERAQILPFKKKINEVIRNVPKQMTWDIEDGSKVVFQLDRLNKAELEDFLVNNGSFDYFLKHNSQEATDFLNNQVENYIVLKHKDDMLKAAIKTSYDTGLKKGAVGAKAPFNMPPLSKPESGDPNKVTLEDDMKVRSVLGRDTI